MMRILVKLHDSGAERTIYGTEKVLERELHRLFPEETKGVMGLQAAIQAINDSGFGEVEVEPYRPSPESQRLPEDYLTHDQGEDPWPREADEE
jgi:hypothetical protein